MTLAEVLVASLLVLMIGLTIAGLMLSYARMARSTVLQERLNSRARRTVKNLMLDIRSARGLALDEAGRLLTVVRSDGGYNEWEIDGSELYFYRDGKEFAEFPARMLIELAPTSFFEIEMGEDARPILHANLHLLEADSRASIRVLVIDTRVACRGRERLALSTPNAYSR